MPGVYPRPPKNARQKVRQTASGPCRIPRPRLVSQWSSRRRV